MNFNKNYVKRILLNNLVFLLLEGAFILLYPLIFKKFIKEEGFYGGLGTGLLLQFSIILIFFIYMFLKIPKINKKLNLATYFFLSYSLLIALFFPLFNELNILSYVPLLLILPILNFIIYQNSKIFGRRKNEKD